MEKDLEQRTKRFSLAVIKFSSSLPRTREIDILIRQLIRSATSIGQIIGKQIVASPEPISQTKSGLFRKKRRKHNSGSSFSSTPVSLMIKAHKNCCRNHQSCSRFSRASGKS